jgi:hypothetical protein
MLSRGSSCNRRMAGALECLYKETKMNKHRDQQDKALEDSFPASDPPANTGITGPRVSTPKAEELDEQDEQQQKKE